MASTQTAKQLKARSYALQYNFGITAAEWEKMFKLQGGCCAICKKEPKGRLHTDHKHILKERLIRKKKEQVEKIRPNVRGLLCWFCNSAIAKFRDCPVLLRSAATYLEDPPARQIIKIT